MVSLVNATTIDLMCNLLSREDYVSFAARVTDVSDAKNLLDFILHLLHDSRLTNFLNGIVDVKQRGRRFMLKVIKRMPVLPESLNVTGIKIPAQHDYIGRGGFGHVVKGELRGDIVALKVLYKADNNIVSYSYQTQDVIWFISVEIGFLSRSVDVAISPSQVRAAVLRNIPK